MSTAVSKTPFWGNFEGKTDPFFVQMGWCGVDRDQNEELGVRNEELGVNSNNCALCIVYCFNSFVVYRTL